MAKLNVNGKVRRCEGRRRYAAALGPARAGWASPAPNTAAASPNAAPARCTSTARCSAPASIPVKDVKPSDKIVTIEGLSRNGDHPVQKAWLALDVPQCGYCQSGQIMAAAALLKKKPKPTDADIDEAMTNICRCGTYQPHPRRDPSGRRQHQRRVHQRQQGLRRRAMTTATASRKTSPAAIS